MSRRNRRFGPTAPTKRTTRFAGVRGRWAGTPRNPGMRPRPQPGLFGAKDWLFVVALVVAVFLVYQPAWQGGFLWDDDSTRNPPRTASWHGLYRIWFDVGATPAVLSRCLHSAFWIEHKLWGDATLGYHLVNILLHAAAAVMVALILRRLKIPGAYLAAAIFALHPVQVESVAWITEQKNTLSAVFYLGAMLAYLRFDQTRKSRRISGRWGCSCWGSLSKTVTATLPAALLVIFWWQRGRLSWRRDVLPLVPFFMLGAAAGVFTAWVECKLIGAEGPAFDLTLARAVPDRRAGDLVLPGQTVLADGTALHLSALAGQPGGMVAIPVSAWRRCSLLAVLWAIRRRWRGPLAGLLFFAGTLFPVLGFFNVYSFHLFVRGQPFPVLGELGDHHSWRRPARHCCWIAGGFGTARPATRCAWCCWRFWRA